VVVVAVVLAIALMCSRASARSQEPVAGVAVRILATLLLPSLALGFVHLYFWPVSLGVSAIAAVLQWRLAPPSRATLSWEWHLSLVPVVVAAYLIAIKAALAISTTPYDIDSNDYHLPMSIAYLQTHTLVPAQMVYNPGNAELLDALGLGALGAVGGQALTEAIVAFALLLAAYAIARQLGANRSISLAAASSTLAIPMIADQLFTAQNDVLVATLILAFVALWSTSPMLSALALGLAAGTKFTGALEALVLVPVLWPMRSRKLSWNHAAVAVAIGCPWYLRNAIETGNPVFLGAQTSGWSSTIAAHVSSVLPFVLTAIRNYAGLLAILGIFCVVHLARQKDLRHGIAPALPLLVAISLVLWFVTPNTAETTPGTLDQIRPGWSIRYILYAAVLLDVAAVVWLSRLNASLAIAVATLSLISAAIREYRAAIQIDAGTLGYVALGALVIAATVMCFVAIRRRIVTMAGFAAVAIFAVCATRGSLRIAELWDQRYASPTIFGPYSVGPALTFEPVQRARRVATIVVPALPLMGARFERHDVTDASGLSAPAWWHTLQRERPQVILARDMPGSGKLTADEQYVRASGRYWLVLQSNGVRVYTQRAADR
jgi:hypothetical protein